MAHRGDRPPSQSKNDRSSDRTVLRQCSYDRVEVVDRLRNNLGHEPVITGHAVRLDDLGQFPGAGAKGRTPRTVSYTVYAVQ